jgi:YHS domain-containing protein
MTTDPVCGMKVDDPNPQHQARYGGQRYSFCSQQCKNEFEQNPEEYAAAAAA